MRLLLIVLIMAFLGGLFAGGYSLGKRKTKKYLDHIDASFAPVLQHSRALIRLDPMTEAVQYILQKDFLEIALGEYEEAYRKALTA